MLPEKIAEVREWVEKAGEDLGLAKLLEAELCLAVADENPPLLAAAQARTRAVRLLD